jgi:hypothetical protein
MNVYSPPPGWAPTNTNELNIPPVNRGGQVKTRVFTRIFLNILMMC